VEGFLVALPLKKPGKATPLFEIVVPFQWCLKEATFVPKAPRQFGSSFTLVPVQRHPPLPPRQHHAHFVCCGCAVANVFTVRLYVVDSAVCLCVTLCRCSPELIEAFKAIKHPSASIVCENFPDRPSLMTSDILIGPLRLLQGYIAFFYFGCCCNFPSTVCSSGCSLPCHSPFSWLHFALHRLFPWLGNTIERIAIVKNGSRWKELVKAPPKAQQADVSCCASPTAIRPGK
jgi:hypothetical protein